MGFYLANAVLANIQNYSVWIPELGFFNSLEFIRESLFGFHETITITTFYSIIVIGLLTGIFFSIIHCKFSLTRKQETSSGLISTIALFLGFLVPGCAACGVGVIALLGFGSSIAALPFQGTEISFIAILLLCYSIIKVTSSFARCSLPKK
ncbi:hypothetical protein FJZ18_00695 [Candidatus Pacearchaeota archaeon]|nr:hypothetical protein [Candidatus Pacearchaeota archaeon]